MKIDVLDFFEAIDDDYEFDLNLSLLAGLFVFREPGFLFRMRLLEMQRDRVREIKKIQDRGKEIL